MLFYQTCYDSDPVLIMGEVRSHTMTQIKNDSKCTPSSCWWFAVVLGETQGHRQTGSNLNLISWVILMLYFCRYATCVVSVILSWMKNNECESNSDYYNYRYIIPSQLFSVRSVDQRSSDSSIIYNTSYICDGFQAWSISHAGVHNSHILSRQLIFITYARCH